MNRISSDLLSQTLNIIQLARETALVQGQKSQAGQLSNVADQLRTVVQNQAVVKPDTQPAPVSGILAQGDFKTLLAAAQNKPEPQPGAQNTADIHTRYQIVQAMSAAQMNDIEIARQLGIAREEVQLIMSISGRSKPVSGV